MSETRQNETGLAEGRWLWRRLYVFVASAALWLLLARAVGRTAPADLPRALAPGQTTTLKLAWAFNIVDNGLFGGRSGYEYFRDTDTYLFFQAQWFPRLVAYTDYTGWQHKQFLGQGEFTLEFGNYDVAITVPADHILTATGVLQNPNDVLTGEQRSRLAQARRTPHTGHVRPARHPSPGARH